jgi:2',3'-cyclic-nucleotide 2'-phosphodiesterase (5'-nucleotidase family)
MTNRIFFIFMLLLVFFAAFADDPGVVKIIYTASLNGNLDGCGCKTHPRAGLVKSAVYIREQHDKKNTILIDAGDMIYMDDMGYALEIADAYSELGYDFVNVGEEDFSSGFENLAKMSKKIRFVSGTLVLSDDLAKEISIGKGPLVKSIGDRRIGIVPLIDQTVRQLFADEAQKKRIEIRDPVAEAKSELDLLTLMKVDCKVLVFHGMRANLEKLLAAVKGFDIAILAHSQEIIDGEYSANTFVVSPGEEGNRVGVIMLRLAKDQKPKLANSFRYFTTDGDPDDARMRARLNDFYSRLKDDATNGGTK